MDDNDDVNDDMNDNDDDDEQVVYERYAENDCNEGANDVKPKIRKDLEMYNVYVNELLEYKVSIS